MTKSTSATESVAFRRDASYDSELSALENVEHQLLPPTSPFDAGISPAAPLQQQRLPDTQLSLMIDAMREQLPADVCQKIQHVIDQVLTKRLQITKEQFITWLSVVAKADDLRCACAVGRMRLEQQGLLPPSARTHAAAAGALEPIDEHGPPASAPPSRPPSVPQSPVLGARSATRLSKRETFKPRQRSLARQSAQRAAPAPPLADFESRVAHLEL